jgi:hypothetical protein
MKAMNGANRTSPHPNPFEVQALCFVQCFSPILWQISRMGNNFIIKGDMKNG